MHIQSLQIYLQNSCHVVTYYAKITYTVTTTIMFIRVKKFKDSHAFQVVENYRAEGKVKQNMVYHIGTLKLAEEFKGQGITLDSHYSIYDSLSKGQLKEKMYNFSYSITLMMIEDDSFHTTKEELKEFEKTLEQFINSVTFNFAVAGCLKYCKSEIRRLKRELKKYLTIPWIQRANDIHDKTARENEIEELKDRILELEAGTLKHTELTPEEKEETIQCVERLKEHEKLKKEIAKTKKVIQYMTNSN